MLQHRSLLPWLTPALGVALAGYIAMTAGYLTLFRRVRPSAFRNLVPTGAGFLIFVGSVGFAGQLASYFQRRQWISNRQISGVLSVGQQIAPLFFFAWFFLWYMIWAGKLGRTRRNLLLNLYLPASLLVLYMSVGGKEWAIVMLALPAVAYWYVRRVMPWKSILIVVLIGIFVIFPLYNTFRNQSDRFDMVRRLNKTVDVASTWSTQGFLDNSIHAFMKRMGIITSVAAVLRDVPDQVDYKYGETLAQAPISIFIPRILWPGKPVLNIGHEFGTTFHLISVVDRETMIAPSLVGEFYWNFGLLGVVIGMFLVGGVYRLVYQKYGTLTGFEPITSGIYIMLFMRLIHFEGSFGGVLGLGVKSYVVLYLIIVVSKKFGLLEPARPVPGKVPGPLNQ
jgi:hypothetical protein